MVTSSLVLAAALLFAIGVAHSVLGERWLIGPLLSPDYRRGMLAKSEFARQVLRFAWHLTTLAVWGFAAILAGLSMTSTDGPAAQVTVAIIAAVCLISAIYIFVTTGARHLAWPVFLVTAGLCVVPLVL